MNDDELINQVYRKIEREKVIINAANAMRQSSNPQVQQSLDSQVREAQKGIGYLEERMRELQMRRTGQSANMQVEASTTAGGGPLSYQSMGRRQRPGMNQGTPSASPPKGHRSAYSENNNDYGIPGSGGYIGQDNLQGGHGIMPPRPPFGPPPPGSPVPKSRREYTKLGW